MEICEKARELAKRGQRASLEGLGKILQICESPIEQILLVALFNRWGGVANTELGCIRCHFGADYPSYDGIFTAVCEPQRTITSWHGDDYRVDFFIYLTRFGAKGANSENNYSPELAKLIVEVDGHDFHERTKNQASRDKRRDRDLLLANCPVIRFTGSDVFNDPDGCAEQIDDYLNKIAGEIFNRFLSSGRLADLICG